MSKKIKVCLVHPVQSPYWTERLRVLSQEDDFELTLMLERGQFEHRPGWKPEPIEGVTIEILNSSLINSKSESKDMGYCIDGIRSVPWALPLRLRRLRPDILLLCNATQVLLAVPMRRLLGFRIGLIVEDTPHSTRGLGWFQRKLKSWAYRKADCLFPMSQDAMSYLANIGITSDIRRTSWSLDMASFGRNKRNHSEADKKKEVPRQRTVLFIGQFIPRKGITHLLDSWASLPSEILSNTQLILTGSGPLRRAAEKFCARENLLNVTFLGQVPYAEVKAILGTTDLFVLPTLQDLCSLTVIEAMASGCPVVTTPFNGARELVEPGINGWIVDPTMPGELAEILARALSGYFDLKTMGQAARTRVEHMDNKIVMSQFAEDLRQLAGTR